MTNAEIIQAIKAEIERLKGICTAQIKANPGQTFPFVMEMTGYDKLLSFLSTLESEKPINPEAAMKELDEKIALVKRRGTWDGVDVDKYMDEVRGRESEKPMNLEEEIKRYYSDNFAYLSSDQPTLSILTNLARHFAEWGYLRAAEKYNEIEYNRQRAEESVPKDLEEAKEAYCEEHNDDCFDATGDKCPHIRNAFIAGAKWQKQHNAELIEIAYNDGITIGMTKQKEQMMEDAVEVCTVVEEGRYCQEIGPLFLDERAGFKPGDKVRIIIVKEDEK